MTSEEVRAKFREIILGEKPDPWREYYMPGLESEFPKARAKLPGEAEPKFLPHTSDFMFYEQVIKPGVMAMIREELDKVREYIRTLPPAQATVIEAKPCAGVCAKMIELEDKVKALTDLVREIYNSSRKEKAE